MFLQTFDFEPEGGIRDSVASRGLDNVYKRQCEFGAMRFRLKYIWGGSVSVVL